MTERRTATAPADPPATRRRRIASGVLAVAILAFIAWTLVDLYPLLRSVAAHQADEHPMIAAIEAYGANGVLILAALQALQVITVFFPAVAVQILGGLVYGVLGGVLVCLSGYLLGNLVIYLLVRELRLSIAPLLAGRMRPKAPKRRGRWDFSFLRDADNAFVAAVVLFLIPGVPNAILSYLLAGTRMSLPRYLLCCACGAPTIVLSCLVGQQLGQGDALVGIVAFSVLAFASLTAYLLRDPLLHALRRLARARRARRGAKEG